MSLRGTILSDSRKWLYTRRRIPPHGRGVSDLTGVTVGERVLVHLAGFARFGDAYECPKEMTQDGIAAALGISRAHTALELKRLRSSGKVEERMAHVEGARTRRKVYVLLPAGQEIARRMREHARTKRVSLRTPDGTRDVPGVDAIDALRRAGLRESEAVQRVLVRDVVEAVPPESPPAAIPPARSFFGREAEIRILRDWLASATPSIAVVVGVAGIGKSALLAKALESERRPALLRRACAHDDGHGLLSSLAEFLARQGKRRLRSVLARPAYDPAEALAVLREDLAGTVVAFDDLQSSSAAEGLLRSLAQPAPPCHVLVASRTRPAFYDRRDVLSGGIREIDLAGLDDLAASDLLASRRGDLDADAVRRVLRATRGHPLALEMFAASGLAAGRIEADRFVVETVLEGLDDASEAVLKAFAVLRRPAPSPERLGTTIAQLRRLVRNAVLQHRDDGYLIHDLVKEFLLGRMDPDERGRMHALAASYWMEREDFLEAAFHRIEAGEPDRAAVLLASRGDAYAESARAGDLEACLLRLPEALRSRRLLAETRMFLGKFAEAKDVLESILLDGTEPERLQARIQLGRIANREGAYADARALLVAAAQQAAASGDRGLEGEALRALGGVERKLGDLAAALEHLARATDLLEDQPREKARALTDLGATLIARGDLAGAKVRLIEAAPLARKGSREDAVIANNLAIVLSLEGKAAEAAKTFERSADLAIRTGEVRFASYALANAVDSLLALNEMHAAAACAERALALAGTIGDPVAVSTARANLGLVFARRGEWAKAEEHLLSSVDLIADLGNPYSLATRYEEIARLYEAQGRRRDAEPWRARAEGLFARLRDGPGGPA